MALKGFAAAVVVVAAAAAAVAVLELGVVLLLAPAQAPAAVARPLRLGTSALVHPLGGQLDVRHHGLR